MIIALRRFQQFIFRCEIFLLSFFQSWTSRGFNVFPFISTEEPAFLSEMKGCAVVQRFLSAGLERLGMFVLNGACWVMWRFMKKSWNETKAAHRHTTGWKCVTSTSEAKYLCCILRAGQRMQSVCFLLLDEQEVNILHDFAASQIFVQMHVLDVGWERWGHNLLSVFYHTQLSKRHPE